MNQIKIKIKFEPGFEDLPVPKYQTAGSSGVDLHAGVEEPVIVNPGEFSLISTGIRISIPNGFEAQVRPRSGLALKHGIGILNGPGTIDSDYRGLIGIILFNFSSEPFVINRGDRIAQMVFSRVEKVQIAVTDQLEMSQRDSGGFGSTGL